MIRSMVADNINHTGAALQMNTGEQAFSRPSIGLVARLRPGHREPEPAGLRGRQPRRGLPGGPALELQLPAQRLSGDARPRPRPTRSPTSPTPPAISQRQRAKLDALGRLNELHKRDRVIDSQLDARIASFELAFRMQTGGARGLRHRAREPRDATRSTGSATRRPTCSAGSACWPAGSRSAACATSSSSTPRRTTPGTTTAASARTCPSAAPRSTARSRRSCTT